MRTSQSAHMTRCCQDILAIWDVLFQLFAKIKIRDSSIGMMINIT